MRKKLLSIILLFSIVNLFSFCQSEKLTLLEQLSFQYDKNYNNNYRDMFVIIDSLNRPTMLNIHVEKLTKKKEFLGVYYETVLTDGTVVTIKSYDNSLNIKNFISETLISKFGKEDDLFFGASDDSNFSDLKFINVIFDTITKSIKSINVYKEE